MRNITKVIIIILLIVVASAAIKAAYRWIDFDVYVSYVSSGGEVTYKLRCFSYKFSKIVYSDFPTFKDPNRLPLLKAQFRKEADIAWEAIKEIK